ncbi:MAG: alpha-glucan family phosphorylase [Planctomycetota bacterium]
MAAPQTGPRPEVIERLGSDVIPDGPCGRATHKLAHPESDEILAGCNAAGLNNAPDDAGYVMFVPVHLDGTDPVLPFTYDEVVTASDATIFPSLYEPWGYTPVESLAAGVPTVTTDLTGFGRYLLEREDESHEGVLVLPLASASEEEVEALLDRAITGYLDTDDERLATIRANSAEVLERVQWDKLIGKTLQAHELALDRAGEARVATLTPSLVGRGRRAVIHLPARSAQRPHLHAFTVAAEVPERLERLVGLARNLWWSWHPEAQALYEELDPERFAAAKGNPVKFLTTLPEAVVATAVADAGYVDRCATVIGEFDRYLEREKRDIGTIAYFSAEFALHECVPIYSGGLGVLAGDHLKSASDLRLPLTAIGLRYADGYFRQRIARDGSQAVDPQHFDPRTMPMTQVLDGDEPLQITIPMPEGDLVAFVWRVDVGQVPLFLLDSRVPDNDEGNQGLTSKLYPSDREWRLRQEILLGMGGWRLLRALKREPNVCHLNEGHSAFLLLERLLELVEERGLTFEQAAVVVRGSSLFTTHTPVPAGHDRFHEELMRRYFAGIARRLGLDWDEFFDLGRTSEEDDEFSMTTLALRLTGRANGVSKLHGEVSRNMLADTWPGLHETETPVASVTNGVHLPTWCGHVLRPVLDKKLGRKWLEEETGLDDWARVATLNDAEIWHVHALQKRRMLEFVRERIETASLRRGIPVSSIRKRIEGLTEDALVIGYARRFAPYKRATLLFRDRERLLEILEDSKRPVRIIYAGKAHPDDGAGGELVREVVSLTDDARFAGKVFFVEDYDMDVARHLVAGVDVWLNTPTRPLEASGTSGMKAALNGALHASILDGWWCEGYDGSNGFAIGDGSEGDDPDIQAERDSRALYRMLESEMVPEYFDRGTGGLPRAWIERMRRSMATVPAFFSTHRMVSDYAKFGYEPLVESSQRLTANSFKLARDQAATEERVRQAWSQVEIKEVSVTDARGGNIGIGETFEVRTSVHLGDLAPDDVSVELYIGQADEEDELLEPVVVALTKTDDEGDGVFQFSGGYMPSGAGRFQYGVRVRPAREDATESAHLGLIIWG